jgi:hypothetical protein
VTDRVAIALTRTESNHLTVVHTYTLFLPKRHEREAFMKSVELKSGDILYFHEIVC